MQPPLSCSQRHVFLSATQPLPNGAVPSAKYPLSCVHLSVHPEAGVVAGLGPDVSLCVHSSSPPHPRISILWQDALLIGTLPSSPRRSRVWLRQAGRMGGGKD